MQKIPFLQYMLAVLEKEKGYTKQTNKQTKIQKHFQKLQKISKTIKLG